MVLHLFQASSCSVLINMKNDVLNFAVFTTVFEFKIGFSGVRTFAKVADHDKRRKWKQSSETFTRKVIAEELQKKEKQSASLSIYDEIRRSYSSFRYICILRTMIISAGNTAMRF